MEDSMKMDQMKKLVSRLNQYRHEYYNDNAPSISDAAYDHLYDALQNLEKETGIVLSNSPTQTVGYTPVSEIPSRFYLWIRPSSFGIWQISLGINMPC